MGLEPGRNVPKGKEGFDSHRVPPFKDRQNFNQQVTLASHLKQTKHPSAINQFISQKNEERPRLLVASKGAGGGSWKEARLAPSFLWLWPAVWVEGG